ncbi:MAG: hypothetical protein J6W08_01460 [Alphaproteobacteria bacterium]|nr:hypothetical protein [Alphaproteobacteria bacterium]
MKKVSLWIFIGLFATANAFAATSAISRAIPTKNSNENVEQKTENKTVKNRSARVVERGQTKNVEASRSVNVSSRSVNNRKNNSRSTLEAAVNTVGRNTRTESASINNNPALRRAGITLRASTAEVGGRATIGNTDVQTGSNIDEQVRKTKTRASILGTKTEKQKTVTAESLAEAKDILEKTSDLNNTCQQQYNECMDQFCSVVDTNQKRCSCSANLDRYERAQKAVQEANTELNDVAQQIRYVGLSADEIRAIMSATEAELELSKTKDNTQTRSMLDDIADMIKDPTASVTTTSNNSSLLELDFDFSSDSADLFSLDLFNSSSNDIASKRGTALYNEAKKRCKAVLNRCKDAGGTESQISGNYELAIDKDCLAYEQGLDKLNQTLLNNVRSAKLMLQKARLAVLQNKNEYDAKDCIAALDKCMLDDMVCGEDYLKCLDPTKRYIDENGNVVLGRNIANITDFMTNYNNANITAETIKSSSNDTSCSNHDGACIVNYLMQKIGTGQSVKDGGLCRPVLDKCQYYTYESNTKKAVYKPYNDIVVNYVKRAMVNIKAAQSRIISNYASTCMADVEECYNQQNTQITSWTTSASVDNIYRVMTGACYNVALTCGYAVFAYDAQMGTDLLLEATTYATNNNLNVNEIYAWSENHKKALERIQAPILIRGISEIFYQSFFCPEHSTYDTTASNITTADVQNFVKSGWVNTKCKCDAGYTAWNGACLLSCADDQYRDTTTGVCTSCTETLLKDNEREDTEFSLCRSITMAAAYMERYENASSLQVGGAE